MKIQVEQFRIKKKVFELVYFILDFQWHIRNISSFIGIFLAFLKKALIDAITLSNFKR